jgi:N utilization substance protein B
MQRGTTARGRQRRYALRILFEIDINRSSVPEVLEGKRQIGEAPPSEFTIQLVKGVQDHLGEINTLISQYAEGWDIGRMPLVDRNVLRMAIFELLYMTDVPAGATIDEAVELAKVFSTEDSGKFVNGVLGSINRNLEGGKLKYPSS